MCELQFINRIRVLLNNLPFCKCLLRRLRFSTLCFLPLSYMRKTQKIRLLHSPSTCISVLKRVVVDGLSKQLHQSVVRITIHNPFCNQKRSMPSITFLYADAKAFQQDFWTTIFHRYSHMFFNIFLSYCVVNRFDTLSIVMH